jgi:tRNA A-37 threonylcarbamoyl transferase component Bud32
MRCFIEANWAPLAARLGLDSVEGAFAYGGGEDLHKAGLGHRRRTRIETADDRGRPMVLYLKRYGPEPIPARWRRWWQTGRWSSPAAAEAAAIRHVSAAGVPTMDLIAWGQQSPGGRSFVVVSAVAGDALERCAASLLAGGEDRGDRLADALAELAGRLHAAGLVHRDFYASHIFAEAADGGLQLSLIDLARVFRPRWRRRRWRVKDLAQLHYSMPASWGKRHWSRFLSSYVERAGGGVPAVLDAAVGRKVARMRRRAARKARETGR